MPNSSANGSGAQLVDWEALKSYIAKKEAYEAQNGRPAPLTDAELSAIGVLLPPAPPREPSIGDHNWVGLLNHFQQVRGQKVIYSEGDREIPRLGKSPDVRRVCSATFESTGDKFPQPGYGFEAGAQRGPDFLRKQDARQYAAKSACEWLVANGYMLPSGGLPEYPKHFLSDSQIAAAITAPASAPVHSPVHSPASASLLPLKRSQPSSPHAEDGGAAAAAARWELGVLPTIPSASAASPSSSSSSPSPTTFTNTISNHQGQSSPKQKPSKAPRTTSPIEAAPSSAPISASASVLSLASTSSASTPEAGAPINQNPLDVTTGEPASKKVPELCKRLNLPVPHLRVRNNATPDGELFDGHADFGDDPRIPDGLGTVHNLPTKKAAQESVADDVVEWLLQMLEQKERTARIVFGK